MTTDLTAATASDYVQRLPIGRRIPFPAGGIPFWEIFPYEGDLQIKVLEPPYCPSRRAKVRPDQPSG